MIQDSLIPNNRWSFKSPSNILAFISTRYRPSVLVLNTTSLPNMPKPFYLLLRTWRFVLLNITLCISANVNLLRTSWTLKNYIVHSRWLERKSTGLGKSWSVHNTLRHGACSVIDYHNGPIRKSNDWCISFMKGCGNKLNRLYDI